MLGEREADIYALVVGAMVTQLRTRHGLTQVDLASRLGITQPTMSRIERGQGRPGPFEMRGIADAFGLTTAELTSLIDVAYERAVKAAKEALAAPPKASDWWKTALAVIGGMGLAGLAGFAVATALADSKKENERKGRPPRRE